MHPKFVLSAAHCFTSDDYSWLTVVFGLDDLSKVDDNLLNNIAKVIQKRKIKILGIFLEVAHIFQCPLNEICDL